MLPVVSTKPFFDKRFSPERNEGSDLRESMFQAPKLFYAHGFSE